MRDFRGDAAGFLIVLGVVALVLLVGVLAVLYASSDPLGVEASSLSLSQEFCEPGRVALLVMGGSVDPLGLRVTVGGALGALDERTLVEAGGKLIVRSSALACGDELVFTVAASGALVARFFTHPSFI